MPEDAAAKPSLGCQLLVVAAVLVLAACVCGGGWLILRHRSADPASAEVNDCLADDPGAEPPFKRVDCDDKAARYRLRQIAGWSVSGPNPCVEVPGATRSFEHYGDGANSTYCLGDKDADPATSINTARPGDCLLVSREHDAVRVECSDQRANFTVLDRRLDLVVSGIRIPGSPSDAPCAGVPGTVTTYGLQWRTLGPPVAAAPMPGKHYDLMLCLRRVHEPPPAVATGPANCRYVTPEGLLTAANSVTGNRYRTARINATTGDAPCTYVLLHGAGGNDVVEIEMTGDLQWPPERATQFTIDGADAAWRDEGVLMVARPTGRVEIRLAIRSSRTDGRAIAEAVYRAAAPHLP